jgi:hypothetical protein
LQNGNQIRKLTSLKLSNIIPIPPEHKFCPSTSPKSYEKVGMLVGVDKGRARNALNVQMGMLLCKTLDVRWKVVGVVREEKKEDRPGGILNIRGKLIYAKDSRHD